MKTLRIATVIGCILIGLAVATVVQGQEPVDNPAGGGVGAQGEIGVASSFLDPPLAGHKVIYMFTGVQKNASTSPTISTRVYCSNYGSTLVNVALQIFPADASFGPTVEKSLESGKTEVFDIIGVDGFSTEQGSGRITATDSADTKIICTVQVYQTTGIPGFIARLHLFDENGNLIDGGDGGSSTGDIYLPVIFKNS